jgi:hypothetical protein
MVIIGTAATNNNDNGCLVGEVKYYDKNEEHEY